jgi:heme exporter protein D
LAQVLSEFFAMGGYAAYVWPAFGFAAVVLLAVLAQSWHAAGRRDAELEQLRGVVRPDQGGEAKATVVRRPTRAAPVPEAGSGGSGGE